MVLPILGRNGETEMDQELHEANQYLEFELREIFKDLEEGNMLTVSQVDTLRYMCGMPKKVREIPILPELFDEFGKILGETK